jgi:hypothetical protein
MVLKAAVARSIFDNYKHDPQTAKDGLKKKPAISFASVLEKAMKSTC